MASLKRIAAELDVSYTLVSKVLNGRLGTTGVSAKTREAIIAKARELEYVPNRLAVALKTGRKGAIGVFFHHMGTPGSDLSDRLFKGLADGLDEKPTRMWVRFFGTDVEFAAACGTRLQSEVDGLIVAGVFHPGLLGKLRELERNNLPVVTLFDGGANFGAEDSPTSVQVSYEAHGYFPTKHLLDLGLRRLACLDTVKSRTDGFMRAHEEAGLMADPKLVVPCEQFSMEDGRKAAVKVLKSKVPPDGIVCQSDAQANGVINELMLRGIKVPDDIKVTGVDNSPLAVDCIVPITSMSSEIRKAGRKAAELLLEKIDRKKVKPAVIQPKLVVRASTGGAFNRGDDRSLLE